MPVGANRAQRQWIEGRNTEQAAEHRFEEGGEQNASSLPGLSLDLLVSKDGTRSHAHYRQCSVCYTLMLQDEVSLMHEGGGEGGSGVDSYDTLGESGDEGGPDSDGGGESTIPHVSRGGCRGRDRCKVLLQCLDSRFHWASLAARWVPAVSIRVRAGVEEAGKREEGFVCASAHPVPPFLLLAPPDKACTCTCTCTCGCPRLCMCVRARGSGHQPWRRTGWRGAGFPRVRRGGAA